MNPLEYYLDLLERPHDLLTLLPLFWLLCFFTKLLTGRLINGLLLLNFSTAIVAWVTLDLFTQDLADASNVLLLGLTELFAYGLCLLVYGVAVRYLRKLQNEKVAASFEKHKTLIYGISFLQIMIQLVFVSWDGSSRIAYQTEAWYSPFRLLLQFLTPAFVFLIFALLSTGRRRAALVLFLLTIMTSLTSGSKSGFVFTLVLSYLVYRDVFGTVANAIRHKTPLLILVALLALANFQALGVDALKIGERITHYAEATVMLLPLEDPTGACKANSTLAKLHRGVGRFLGDPSSVDVDNLFGYALMIEFYGINTFTGPNARIGPYALCNFKSGGLSALISVYVLATLLCIAMLSLSRRLGTFMQVAVGLLVMHLAVHLSMDYNTAMSDLTGLTILSGVLLVRKLIQSGASTNEGGNPKLV